MGARGGREGLERVQAVGFGVVWVQGCASHRGALAGVAQALG